MYCTYCGTKLTDDALFCHACGKPVDRQPVEQTPVETPAAVEAPAPVQPVPPEQPVCPPAEPAYTIPAAPAPVYEPPVVPTPACSPEEEKLQKQIFLFGILGLSLSVLGVPGIVFSSIAVSKANELKKKTGKLTGKAKTGYGLAKAGKPVSIVLTVIWAITLTNWLSDLDLGSEFGDSYEIF